GLRPALPARPGLRSRSERPTWCLLARLRHDASSRDSVTTPPRATPSRRLLARLRHDVSSRDCVTTFPRATASRRFLARLRHDVSSRTVCLPVRPRTVRFACPAPHRRSAYTLYDKYVE